MKLIRSISLVLLCIAFVPSLALAQTAQIDALREKAKSGDSRAQFLLYSFYSKGLLGVKKNEVEALKWLKISSQRGYAPAQHFLATHYLKSKDDADTLMAINLIQKSAEGGYNKAQFLLGKMYFYGTAFPADKIKAINLYTKAAEQGAAVAQGELASIYLLGNGVPENIREAVKWGKRGAAQGNREAQAALGALYADGKGVPQNNVESYKWFNLAEAQGNTIAKTIKRSFAATMSPQEIAEAQKLSLAFKPKKEIPNKSSGPLGARNFTNANPDSFGSGFYVTSNGYLLTNQHVVDGARKVFVYSGSQRLPAQVVKTDAANDLALLKVTGTFAALPVSSSRRVKLGQTVSTVGFPNPNLQGKSPKLTKGEISSLSGASDDPKYFQISVPLQPGNSGGPLVDGYGNVVGVVTAKLSTKAALATAGTLPENVNYAVKGTFVMGFLESVPDVAAEMLDPKPRRSREFTEVVSEAEKASVMILVYE
jgi:S1-C subfamily serine protease